MEVVSRVVWCGGAGRARAARLGDALPEPEPAPAPEPDSRATPVPVSAHARREGSGQGAVDGRRGWHAGVGPWDLRTQQRAIGREPPTRSAAMITLSRLQNMRTLIRDRGDATTMPLQHDSTMPLQSAMCTPREPVPQWGREGKGRGGEGREGKAKIVQAERNEQPRFGIRQSPQTRSRRSVALSHAIRVCNP
jgi:hypothetical protein